jgi:glycosyltransferase involved in cell wall biosynthesis
MPRTILYQGLLRSAASWARVGRGLVGALVERGVNVPVVSPRGFGHDPGFALPAGVCEWSPHEAKERGAQCGLGFLHPPHLGRLLGDYRLNLFVWESDRVPAAWVTSLRQVDRVLVPSSFTADALVRSGFPREGLGIVPYGYSVPDGQDRSLPARSSGGAETFRILSIVSPHRRKGVGELLLAYRRAFSAADDVRLELKTTYDPAERKRRFPFEISSWDAALQAAGLRERGAPTVEVSVATLTDAETRFLYSAADLCVQPSWGESFGLAVLEAAALGRPVVTTGWSAPVEFMPPGDDLLPYRLEEAGDALYEPVPGAQVAVPDVDALVDRLRWHYANREASRRLGEEARRAVVDLTWGAAAGRLLAELPPEEKPHAKT